MDGIRLQKFLADCGVASRRKSEEIITQGRVTVNGAAAVTLGAKVQPGDAVEVDGKPVKPVTKKLYLLLNKPVGYVTTVADDFGRSTVLDLIKNEIRERVFPVGRLDYDTEGLLLLTNDGGVAYTLTHPKHRVPKTYVATLNEVPAPTAVDKLRRGVFVDGRRTSPARVEWLRDNILKLTVTEGRNRQIRKMAEAVGYEVTALKRVAIGSIMLGNVPLGRWRHLTKTEVDYLKRSGESVDYH
jgi:23S rRNA pseudouridine2605 synthase